jgi:hypothetical protein
MVILPETYGAVGDGITDDTKAVQSAIDYWVRGPDNVLSIQGKYRITSTLATKVTRNITESKIIRGMGGLLIDDFGTNTGPLLSITVNGSTYLWRNIHIYDLNIVSGVHPNATSYLQLDGGRESIENGYEALYSFDIVGLVIQGPTIHGVQIVGNAFEGQITGGRIETNYNVGYGVYIVSDLVSSLYLDKFTISGFNNGILNSAGDVRATNLTVLKSGQAGIVFTNNISGIIQNCHVENTYLQPHQSGAGITMINVCRSINNYGTSNEGGQSHVIGAWSTQTSNVIIGGFNQGNTFGYAKLRGAGTYELIGVPSYDADFETKINTSKRNKGFFSRIFR